MHRETPTPHRMQPQYRGLRFGVFEDLESRSRFGPSLAQDGASFFEPWSAGSIILHDLSCIIARPQALSGIVTEPSEDKIFANLNVGQASRLPWKDLRPQAGRLRYMSEVQKETDFSITSKSRLNPLSKSNPSPRQAVTNRLLPPRLFAPFFPQIQP